MRRACSFDPPLRATTVSSTSCVKPLAPPWTAVPRSALNCLRASCSFTSDLRRVGGMVEVAARRWRRGDVDLNSESPRMRVQRKIGARALAVVIPCYICLGRPVYVGENRLTFISFRTVERLAMALVLDVRRPVQRREQGRQHGGKHADGAGLGRVHDSRELCVAAAAKAARGVAAAAEAAQQSGAAAADRLPQWCPQARPGAHGRMAAKLQPQERSHLSKSNASRQLGSSRSQNPIQSAAGRPGPNGMPSMACPARKSPRRNKQLHVKEAVEARIKTAAVFHDATPSTSTPISSAIDDWGA